MHAHGTPLKDKTSLVTTGKLATIPAAAARGQGPSSGREVLLCCWCWREPGCPSVQITANHVCQDASGHHWQAGSSMRSMRVHLPRAHANNAYPVTFPCVRDMARGIIHPPARPRSHCCPLSYCRKPSSSTHPPSHEARARGQGHGGTTPRITHTHQQAGASPRRQAQREGTTARAQRLARERPRKIHGNFTRG